MSKSICRTYPDGNRWWCIEGTTIFHREDGPSIEYYNGNKCWYVNGKCHRKDGPAVEYANGNKEWYYNGEKLDCKTQEEFEILLKLRAFW